MPQDQDQAEFTPDFEAIVQKFTPPDSDDVEAGAESIDSEAAETTEQNTAAEDQPQEAESAEAEPKSTPEDEAREPEKAPEAPAETKSSQILALARRERDLREKERSLEADFEKRVADAVQAKLAEIEQQALSNPARFFKERGVEDLGNVANDLYYETLGDDAPEEFKRRYELNKLRAEQEQFKREQAQLREEMSRLENSRRVEEYLGTIRSHVNQSPESEYVYLKAEFTADPKGAHQALNQAAEALYQQLGYVPSASEVASALNSEIEKIANRYSHLVAGKQGTPTSTTNASQKTLTETSPKSKNLGAEFDKEEAIRNAIRIGKASFKNNQQ